VLYTGTQNFFSATSGIKGGWIDKNCRLQQMLQNVQMAPFAHTLTYQMNGISIVACKSPETVGKSDLKLRSHRDKFAFFYTQMLDLEKRRKSKVPLRGEKHL